MSAKLLLIAWLVAILAAPEAMAEAGPKVLTGSVRAERPTELGIIGLDMAIRPHRWPLVQAVFPGTPAASRGIQAGDVILAVDGISTQGKNDQQVDAMISDVPGTLVRLSIQRDERLLDVNLTVAPKSQLSVQQRRPFL